MKSNRPRGVRPLRGGRLGDVLQPLARVAGAHPGVPANAIADDGAMERRRMVAAFCRLFDPRAATAPEAANVGRPAAAAATIDPALPRRQRQTLQLLLRGDSEKQIARKLGLSRHTVHVYVKSLHKRYAVSSRSELLARYIHSDLS